MVTEAVILAGGYSSRMGQNKMLLKLGEKSIIEHCIESFYEACSSIIIVGGYRLGELKEVLNEYNKLKVVFNNHYRDGMFSSVKEGIAHIKGDRFFLTPGDYPIIRKSTVGKMLEIDKPIVIPKYHGRRGHPVLMKSGIIPEIFNCRYQSLNEFINTRQASFIEVDDIGVITDVDTMQDYYKVKNIRR